MSHNFFVWNPSVESTDPLSVREFVTLGISSRIGTGTTEFVAGCLAAAEVDGTILRWTMERYRTHYFTEYPYDDEAWEDRWQPAWRIHAELAPGAKLLGDSIDGRYPCDAEDMSWSEETSQSRTPAARCLLLVDFPTEAALVEARTLVAEWVQGSRVGTSMSDYFQLELDLGLRDQSFYDGGDGLAKDLLAMCRDLGGYTHYFNSVAEIAARPRPLR